MDVKKAIRKVVALGTGALMVGATVMGAMAANLDGYPAPFVSKGTDGKPVWNGYMIVGASALAMDTLAVNDVSNQLQREEMVYEQAISGSSASVSVTGGYAIDSVSNHLNYGDTLRGIKTQLTRTESTLLADVSVAADNTVTGEQTLVLDPDVVGQPSAVFQASESGDTPYEALRFGSGAGTMYTYKMTFSSGLKGTTGQSSTVNQFLNQKITLFGKEFAITTITQTASTSADTLILFAGSAHTTLTTGGSEYSAVVEGVDIKAKLVNVADQSGTTSAVLDINGQSVLIRDGQTKKVSVSGKEIEIGVNNVASIGTSGEGLADVYLGATKLEFTDDFTASVTDGNAGGTVRLGSDVMPEYYVDLVGTEGSTTAGQLTITEIQIDYNPNTEIFLKDGSKFTDKAFGFDLSFAKPSTATEDIKLTPNSQAYTLSYVTDAGYQVNQPILYDATNAATGQLALSDTSGKDIHVYEGASATNGQYIMLSTASSINQPGKGGILKVTPPANASLANTVGVATFTDITTGTGFTVEGMGPAAVGTSKSFNYKGNTYTVVMTSVTPGSEAVKVIDSATETLTVFPVLDTKNGHKIALLEPVTITGVTNAVTTLRLPTGDKALSGLTALLPANGVNSTLQNFVVGGIQYAINETDYGSGANSTIVIWPTDQAGTAYVGESTGAASEKQLMIIEKQDENSVQGIILIKASDVAGSNYNLQLGNPSFYKSTGSPTAQTSSGAKTVVGKDKDQYLDFFGALVEKTTLNQPSMNIVLPYEQIRYTAAIGGTLTKSSDSGQTSKEIIEIPVAASKQDSDITGKEKELNLIIVGGPCANKAVEAAGFMKCEDWKLQAGQAVIKTVANGEKMAMLIAGTDAADTRRAGVVVRNYKTYKSSGKWGGDELLVEGTDLVDIKVSKVQQ